MTEIRNNKQKNKKNGFGPCFEFEICDLFELWCLEFMILDTKLQGRAIYLLPCPENQVFNVKIKKASHHCFNEMPLITLLFWKLSFLDVFC